MLRWPLITTVLLALLPVGGAAAPSVQDAPSGEALVRAVLGWLPAVDTVGVSVEFRDEGRMDNPGACGEVELNSRVIRVNRSNTACFVYLGGLLAHEVGHLQPHCAALLRASLDSEPCAEEYRRQKGF